MWRVVTWTTMCNKQYYTKVSQDRQKTRKQKRKYNQKKQKNTIDINITQMMVGKQWVKS